MDGSSSTTRIFSLPCFRSLLRSAARATSNFSEIIVHKRTPAKLSRRPAAPRLHSLVGKNSVGIIPRAPAPVGAGSAHGVEEAAYERPGFQPRRTAAEAEGVARPHGQGSPRTLLRRHPSAARGGAPRRAARA